MIIARPGYEIMTDFSMYGTDELELIERAGRVCYKSEDRITDQGESAKKFISSRIAEEHEGIIEHSIVTIRFICDRGVSHELVRHRLVSWTQESTRYCNYSKDKFGNQITVIEPSYLKPGSDSYTSWFNACMAAEKAYMEMLGDHCSAQEARCVLPMSLKTELIGTANFREWRHVLKLRTSPFAHPQMREIMLPLLGELHERVPVIFDDLYEETFGSSAGRRA